jgi:D-Tyr-tRNAtyr deacylase
MKLKKWRLVNFGAQMEVSLLNDGPVTIILEN